VTEAHACEQLALFRYPSVFRCGVEPAPLSDLRITRPARYRWTNEPHSCHGYQCLKNRNQEADYNWAEFVGLVDKMRNKPRLYIATKAKKHKQYMYVLIALFFRYFVGLVQI